MAVSFVANSPGAFLDKLGFKPALVKLLSENKVEMVVTPTKVQFTKNGTLLSHCNIKQGALTLVKQGKLGPLAAEHLIGTLEQGATQALTAIGVDVAKATSILSAKAALKPKFEDPDVAPVTKEVEPASEEVTDLEALNSLIFPVHQMKYAARVPLTQAKHLYQPVEGTSAGSRYYVVGLSKDLKVAARFTGSQVSIRLEGDLDKHAAALGLLGIPCKGNYASVHVGSQDMSLLRRAVGAVLTGLDGVEFYTPTPKLANLVGK